MNETAIIRSFVKDTLGCQCPDDVFHTIEVHENIKLNIDLKLRAKINIGNRLLVYLIHADDAVFVNEHLVSLVFFGRDEKDQKQFNTFRLVFITEAVDEVKRSADSIYTDLSGVIDLGGTIHIHVIRNSDLPL